MSAPFLVPHLPLGTAHLWEINLDGLALADSLSNDERARALRFHFDRDRNRFIAGRNALRSILGGYLQTPPQALNFSYGPAGKPSLPDTEISFNLAHSGPYALVAVTRQKQLGVDIEQFRTMDDMSAVAQFSFAHGEFERWQRLSREQQLAAFYRCWTRKEAYLKAIGEGIATRLQRFEVSFEPGAQPQILNGAEGVWTLLDFTKESTYAAALACEGPVASVECFHLTAG